MLSNQYYVYFLTNWNNKVLYVGVTNDLKRRIYEHKNALVEGFTRKYNVNKLVYCEICEDIEGAFSREKQIKAGSRNKKNELVSKANHRWDDLADRYKIDQKIASQKALAMTLVGDFQGLNCYNF